MKKGVGKKLPKPVFDHEAGWQESEETEKVSAQELVGRLLNDECPKTDDRKSFYCRRQSKLHTLLSSISKSSKGHPPFAGVSDDGSRISTRIPPVLAG